MEEDLYKSRGGRIPIRWTSIEVRHSVATSLAVHCQLFTELPVSSRQSTVYTTCCAYVYCEI